MCVCDLYDLFQQDLISYVKHDIYLKKKILSKSSGIKTKESKILNKKSKKKKEKKTTK